MKPNCSPTARNEIGCWVKTDVEGRRLCVLSFALLCLGLLTVTSVPALVYAADFNSNWTTVNDRVWAGPEYWANPMEDWRIADGRLECATGGGARNVHVLTRELGTREGNFEMSVRLGRIDQGKAKGSAGFSFAIQDEINDYRARVFRGKGINATIAGDGTLTLGAALRKIDDMPVSVELRLSATPSSEGYRIKLSAHDPKSGRELGMVGLKGVPAEKLVGNIALVQNPAASVRAGGGARFWFSDWKISGTKVDAHPEHTFGPILWAMHTLSRNVLKMTAQMPPLGKNDSRHVQLQVKEDGEWKTIAREKIDPLARTATFRIADWDSSRDIPYRLTYATHAKVGSGATTGEWIGIVRKDPVDKPSVVVAGFTGNKDTGFPNREIVKNLRVHDPDVLFFSGDQIYEDVGGYGSIHAPVDRAVINYLRKWYMLGWAFGDVMRDRVTICLPDDHDVYQGNVWGQGGIDCGGIGEHDSGGYAQHPDFVNVVHRTQTSHHPDPFDPQPIARDISVYYGDMIYGRIGFAIIADRMFKSGPKGKVDTGRGRADWVIDKEVDIKALDRPGLELLGERQLKFLRHWAADWKGTDMKMVLSQTIFCNLANYIGGGQMFIVADLDSNGWPQSGRNRALEEMRRGMAFHLAGDQHLPSIVQHGIDRHNDAGYSFCVPSIAAGYPRSWRPDQLGRPLVNRPESGLPNTGEYLDGLGNRVTVHAIGNPARKNRPGRINTLHDKSSGYAVVRMNKPNQTITMECWRLLVDVANPKPADQFPGWPKTITMQDNYARRATAYLPEIKVSGLDNPVIQVIDQSDDRIVYTLRTVGNKFRPKVFRDGKYTVTVSEPHSGKKRTIVDVEAIGAEVSKQIEVKF